MSRAPLDWDAARDRLAAHARAQAAADGEVAPARAAEVLIARARDLAAPRVVAAPTDEVDLVMFETAGERLAIATAHVRAVAPLPPLTPLPHAPPALRGVAVIGGELLGVWDLGVALGWPGSAAPTHAVVLGGGRAELALLADQVSAVERIPRASIGPPLGGRAAAGDAIGGLIAERAVLVLDGHALLQSPTLRLP